jgi:hypothetical protein
MTVKGLYFAIKGFAAIKYKAYEKELITKKRSPLKEEESV